MSKRKNNIQNSNRNLSQTSFQTYQYISPIPPASEMKNYSEIDPDFPKLIMQQWIKQTEHRQNLENKVIDSDIKNSNRGIWFAFIISIIGILTGGAVAIWGNEMAGSIISISSLVGLVSSFIYGTNSRKKERESKKN